MAQFTGDLVKAREEGIKWKGVLDGVFGTTLELAKTLPLIGGAIDRVADANARRVAEEQASIARRTSSGRVGRPAETADPDAVARLTCTISGGTWDAKNRRCVPKSTSTAKEKPLTFDEVLARNRDRRDRQFQEDEARLGGQAEAALREQLAAEAELSLAQLERFEAAEQAADDQIQRNREAARSIVDLIDPTAQFVRQLEEVRRLVGEGFLTEQQGLEAEFAIQGMIDRVLEFGRAAKDADDIGRDLGLTFSSALEDAIVKGEEARDVIKGLGQDIARILVRESITKPIAGGISDLFKSSGGGNLLSSLGSSVAKLLGFASGGSFTVAGGGGTDSQLVAFRATPGERVTVETPAQQRGGGMTVINQFVDISGQIRDQIARATPAIVDAAVAQVADLRRRGVAI
jgi:hypothetical protein